MKTYTMTASEKRAVDRVCFLIKQADAAKRAYEKYDGRQLYRDMIKAQLAAIDAMQSA